MQIDKTLLFVALFLALPMHGDSDKAATADGITEGFVTTSSGIRIHYLDAGSSGSAQTLILIPGWRLPAYLWTEQLKTFSGTNRVLAIDARSQGESTKITEGNSPEFRAADLHDALAELRISQPVLVGWSQGAQDVAAYLEKFGSESVAGVVFVDSPVSWGSSEVDAHREFAKIILSGISAYETNPDEFSQGYVRSIFKKPHPELDIQAIVKFTLQTPTDVGIAMLASDIFGADRRPAVAKLDKPALIIASAQSPLLDVEKEMAKTIPGCKFISIEGTGHAVFVDQPAKFDNALNEFLKSLSNK